MAWTAPVTMTDDQVLTAADWNTYIRDNLNETAPAKATTGGRYFAVTGPNAIAERSISNDNVGTAQSTTSTSYTDLDTVGPSVTRDTGPVALVFWAAQVTGATAGSVAYVGVEISGATTASPSDNDALIQEISVANDTYRIGMCRAFTTLTAGTNTFTLKYRSGGGQEVTFRRRSLFVVPF